jgi:4-hydroxybenzoate polyprenyltransferase
MNVNIPIIVDLDGTLIHTDLLHESCINFFLSKPMALFKVLWWLINGRAILKAELAKRVNISIPFLPYNNELIDYLKKQRNQGRKIILCTASNQIYAQSIAEYLGIFDKVLASNERVNLAGLTKSRALVGLYGNKGFDYAGNSSADLNVWRHSRHVIVVNGSLPLIKKISGNYMVVKKFPKKNDGFISWLNLFRLHQWVKNILIFIPAFAAHTTVTGDLFKNLILAFFSFSLCASAVYVVNDLLDLESDRRHPRKRCRPFASGQIPIWIGVVLAPVLILLSLLLAADVGNNFFYWLLIYLALTSLYSWSLKRLVIVDVLTLAILFTMRIVAGASALEISLSFWILAFSIFLFISLAFIKRYVELRFSFHKEVQKLHGRGYITSDAALIQQLGISSGYAAVLVLALYINSENIVRLYGMPEMIWGSVPLLLWWLSWMWFQANRGLMHDDPIVFAIKDRTSLFIGALFFGTFVLAR